MPELQEVFRVATQEVRPEPGALERQFRGQRRRSARRKAGAVGLALALALVAGVIAVQASRDTGQGGGTVPADTGSGPSTLQLEGAGLAFSEDGTQVFVGGAKGLVYDAQTGALLRSVEDERSDGVVGFSPDGELFVTATGGELQELHTFVHETATGAELLDIRKACCVAVFTADGRRLALPYAGHTRVIDVESGDVVNDLELFGTVAFSPDGDQLVVTSSEEGIVALIFDLGPLSSEEPVVTLRGSSTGEPFVTQVAWSPDGSTLVTVSNDREAVLWDATTGTERSAIASTSGRFTSVAFGSDPERFATGSSDGTAIVWQLTGSDARPIFTEQVDMGNRDWLTVALSPDGTRSMASSGSQTTVWDLS